MAFHIQRRDSDQVFLIFQDSTLRSYLGWPPSYASPGVVTCHYNTFPSQRCEIGTWRYNCCSYAFQKRFRQKKPSFNPFSFKSLFSPPDVSSCNAVEGAPAVCCEVCLTHLSYSARRAGRQTGRLILCGSGGDRPDKIPARHTSVPVDTVGPRHAAKRYANLTLRSLLCTLDGRLQMEPSLVLSLIFPRSRVKSFYTFCHK